jgi:hypothetical protein
MIKLHYFYSTIILFYLHFSTVAATFRLPRVGSCLKDLLWDGQDHTNIFSRCLELVLQNRSSTECAILKVSVTSIPYDICEYMWARHLSVEVEQ